MNQKTLLVVDDSKVARMFIHTMVAEKRSDWKILEAPDGAHALSIAEDTEIDYFSVDYNMPGIDGLSLIKELKPKYPGSKMALMTANIQSSIIEKTKEVGVPCINKPVTPQTIATLLSFFDD